MAKEIERKFLVAGDAWREQSVAAQAMRQGYLASNPECSIRVRVAGAEAWFNIKSATLGIERTEFEFPIPAREASEVLDRFCGGRCLDKVRYYCPHAGHTWEVDVFTGVNAGLVVAEIELAAVDEAFERPAWLGREVSDDPRYYNVCLIDHPYSAWTDRGDRNPRG